jgi:hypothetical protein
MLLLLLQRRQQSLRGRVPAAKELPDVTGQRLPGTVAAMMPQLLLVAAGVS